VRILFSAYAVSPIRGSEPGNSWRLASALAARGHSVELVTTSRYADEWPAGPDWPTGLSVTTIGDRVPSLFNRGQIGVYARYLAWQSRSLRAGRRLNEAQSFDVVHHFSWGSLMWGSPLWKLGRPFVLGPVGGGSVGSPELSAVMPPSSRRRERMRRAVFRLLMFNPRTRSSLRHSTVVWANSDTAHLAEAMPGNQDPPVMLMPEAVTPQMTVSEPVRLAGRNMRRILWVGRALPIKGLPLAIHVLSLLPDDYTLTVLGDGPDLERAQRAASTLGVTDRVTFTGRLPWDEVLAEMDTAAVILFTSVRDTTGAQVLEAAARGTPVAAIAQHGIADYVPRTAGVLVPPGPPATVAASLADGLLHLLTDEAHWNAASAASLEFAARHGVDRQADDVLALYARASSSPDRAAQR
jgi:glycosyltransferase involved in cell wall biosynthesis